MARKNGKVLQDEIQAQSSCIGESLNLSNLRNDETLWYRVHVLLYDLNNVALDPAAEKRISSTVNPLYISEPYFTDLEATKILKTIIEKPFQLEKTSDDMIALTDEDRGQTQQLDQTVQHSQTSTVEETLSGAFSNFLTKRKASGDSRPCGPHDMLPVCCSVFGISKKDLQDEKFLSRLRRSELGCTEPKVTPDSSAREKGGKQTKKTRK